MHKEIIVTVDIGTSKIVAAAGEKDEKGVIHILALETEAAKTFVRRGRIYSIVEVNRKITSLLNRLNNKLNEKIVKVYVGIGGQSLITAKKSEGTVRNEELFQPLCEKCDVGHPDLIILGNPAIKRDINKCICNGDMEITGYFIAPVATAIATLTDYEKNQGCALIEFGAGVTYLSVYKNNLLEYLVTIPIGADVITKDITLLKEITEEDAEDLKITYGHALASSRKENDYPKKITANDKEIDTEDFNNIIEARVDEIIANINNQLELSGFSNALASGIVIAGGGAALKSLAESIEEKTKQKVRIATVKEELIDVDSLKYIHLSGIEETIGLLSLGTENCVKKPEIPIIQSTITENFTDSLFKAGEIEVVEKEKKGKRKPPPPPVEKEDDKKNKILTLFDRLSKGLFAEEDSTDKENENEKK